MQYKVYSETLFSLIAVFITSSADRGTSEEGYHDKSLPLEIGGPKQHTALIWDKWLILGGLEKKWARMPEW